MSYVIKRKSTCERLQDRKKETIINFFDGRNKTKQTSNNDLTYVRFRKGRTFPELLHSV